MPLWLVYEFVDKGEWVAVMFCDLVEVSVVVTEAELPVLFLHEEHRTGVWGLRGSDEALFEVIIDVFPKHFGFFGIKGVNFGWGWEYFLSIGIRF